jgi:hypothetical protein
MLGHLLLIVVVAVEWSHEPVVSEEGPPLTLVVDVCQHHLSLQQHLLLLYCSESIATLGLLSRVQELTGVPALPALEDVAIKFFIVSDADRFPYHLHQGFTVAKSVMLYLYFAFPFVCDNRLLPELASCP